MTHLTKMEQAILDVLKAADGPLLGGEAYQLAVGAAVNVGGYTALSTHIMNMRRKGVPIESSHALGYWVSRPGVPKPRALRSRKIHPAVLFAALDRCYSAMDAARAQREQVAA